MELQFVKLGGSLLTDKSRPETVDGETLRRLAGEIFEARCEPGDDRTLPLVLGHGSGSFGHVAARESGLPSVDSARRAGASRDATELASAAAKVQSAAHRLHRLVIDSLIQAGVACFSFPPSSWLFLEGGEVRSAMTRPLLGALSLGMVPVICGDVVFDAELGPVVCSTETVFEMLVDELWPESSFHRALWLGRTAGVLDELGRPMPTIDSSTFAQARDRSGGASGVDVTGGMRHRVEKLWALSRRVGESRIADGQAHGLLRRALHGRDVPATVVRCNESSVEP